MKNGKEMSVSAKTTRKNARKIIAIDPDSEKSGFAVLLPEKKKFATLSCFSFAELIKQLQGWKNETAYDGAELHVYIEGGWLNKSNWHLTAGKYTSIHKAAEIGRRTGCNHQTGILIAEMCAALGIKCNIVKPLKKNVARQGRKDYSRRITTHHRL